MTKEVRFSDGQQAARECLARHRYACVFGGTRSGKTFLITRAIIHRALRGENSRHAMLRFRGNAARASLSLDTLPTVLRRCFPGVVATEHRQEGYFEFQNGAQIWVGGLDDKQRVEKILGLEFATIFLNEASQIPHSSATIALTRLAQVIPGLTQRAFVDLNPVGKAHWTNRLFVEHVDPISRKLLADPENYGWCRLNPIDNRHNLAPEFLRSLENLPEKQRKRFYEGVFVDEIDGALWTLETIEACRVASEEIAEDKRSQVVVAVDPSGAGSKEDGAADEIGIVVAAKGQDGHGYVLDDLSLRDSPAVWGRRAVDAYHRYKADCIVAETNFGGAMVEAVIRAADPNVPVRLVTASRGKALRAEPVSVLYQRGLIHHAGRFDRLEDQMCSFSGSGYMGQDSPDHADAMVHGITYLLGIPDGTAIIDFYRGLAEASGKSGPQFGYAIGAAAGNGDVALYAPAGLFGIVTGGETGRSYQIDPDGIVTVAVEDLALMQRAGFRKVEGASS